MSSSTISSPPKPLLTKPSQDVVKEMGVHAGDAEIIDPNSGVKRALKTRHISMMALAGIIGPGLLVGSGGALAEGGPAALLIGFGTIGIIAFSVMQSLGELTTLYPSGGGFTKLAERFVDDAFGTAVGWTYFILWFATLSNEYNTSAAILTFWSDKVPIYGYFLILWFTFLGFQLLGVESFGEAEFWLALFKLVGLVAFFLFATIYDAGGIRTDSAIGFSYWHDPGPFTGGFRGVAKVFVFCSAFYSGIESVAVTAAETRNPKAAVPLAIRQVFWRIIFVYMGSAFLFGLVCPANAPGLLSGSSKVLQSPMTVAIQHAGWEGGVHLINAFILVTCLSAVNSSIYLASRTLLYLAQERRAPRIFAQPNKRGVPVLAVIFSNACGAISLMNISTSAGQAYKYIVNIAGVSTFLVWASISFTHIRFRRAWVLQGHSVNELPFVSWGYPWNAYFGLGASVFLTLIQGWSSLSPFKAADFVDAYILLVLFIVLVGGYKFALKSRFWKLEEIDLNSGQRLDLDEAKEEVISARSEDGGDRSRFDGVKLLCRKAIKNL